MRNDKEITRTMSLNLRDARWSRAGRDAFGYDAVSRIALAAVSGKLTITVSTSRGTAAAVFEAYKAARPGVQIGIRWRRRRR